MSDNESVLQKPPPSSPEAERAFIGAILLDPLLIAQAIEVLKNPDDLSVPANKLIYRAMISLFEQGKQIMPLTLGEELSKKGNLDRVGSYSYIANTGTDSITYGLPHSTNIIHYAKVIRGKATLRRLITVHKKGIEEAYTEEDYPERILEHAQSDVFAITLDETTDTFASVGNLSHNSLQTAWDIKQSGKTLTGLSTGFTDLDILTLGLQRKDLILIAGRPSMGKTGLGLMIAQNAAIRGGANVGFFSLEMPKEQIIMRIHCSEMLIDSRRYRNGYINPDEWDKLSDLNDVLKNTRLWIDDTPSLSALQIKARAMRLVVERGPLDLLVVDHLGLMAGAEGRFESRQQEVSKISADLKDLAKILNVPLIALCQLNRSPEGRTDHRPQLADLRESGALEQNADVVGLLYRADKYRPAGETKDNTAELNLAKQRNGPTDYVALRFDASSTRFDNLYQPS